MKTLSRYLVSLLALSAAVICTGCPSGTEKVKCGPPSVDAGQDITASVGQMVVLSARISLPPEDEKICQEEKSSLRVEWEQLSGPQVELTGADQPQASFVPPQAGSYSFRCRAIYPVTPFNQQQQVSQWDTVTVEVSEATCPSPVASAGDDAYIAVESGQPQEVILDGSDSHPGQGPGCEGLEFESIVWTQVSGPEVNISGADQLQASVSISQPGNYKFRLEVRDNGGTTDRLDTASDEVDVFALEKTPCEGSLEVSVVDALNGQAVSQAEVTVVDAAGQSHRQSCDGDGKAVFSGLSAGTLKSITASATETVPALVGAGERPKYETTTLLNICTANVTIPLRLTESGRLANDTGTIEGKVPESLWQLLPHSYRCSGSCSGDSDCQSGYYCEQQDARCRGLCTPKSLLPFFSLGGDNISGQFRVAILTEAFSGAGLSRLPLERLFGRPPNTDALLPGNLATDDSFLNGIAANLGIDPWGQACASVSDCPDRQNWTCAENESGKTYCRQKLPLSRVILDVPAGSHRTLVLILGIINVDLNQLLPLLMPFLQGSAEGLSFNVAELLAGFKMQTLLACPLDVDVVPNNVTSIDSLLNSIGNDDCITFDYQYADVVEPLVHPGAVDADNACDPDPSDCTEGGPLICDCKQVAGNYECMQNPSDGQYYCMQPMYRVDIAPTREVEASANLGAFDPTRADADWRTCSLLPETGQHEVMCPNPDNGMPQTCTDANGDPAPVYCTMPVDPQQTDCSFPFAVSLATIKLPRGNQWLPMGGYLVIGYDFNRTPVAFDPSPAFLLPDAVSGLEQAKVALRQTYFRNLVTLSDMSYLLLPGTASTTIDIDVNTAGTVEMPELIATPRPEGLGEAPFDIRVRFVPDDPFADCNSATFEKVYAVTKWMHGPDANQQLPEPPSLGNPQGMLQGLLLHVVDRLVGGDGEEDIRTDPLWRIYAPAGTASYELPMSVSPFSSGREVLLTFWSSGFSTPFFYDVFPARQVLLEEQVLSEDGWFLLVP